MVVVSQYSDKLHLIHTQQQRMIRYNQQISWWWWGGSLFIII